MSSPDGATPDDVTLVTNEIERCMTEAGNRLHPQFKPDRYGAAFKPGDAFEWNMLSTSVAPVDNLQHQQARFYLDRAEYLQRLGTAKAAAYLRRELLDASAARRPNGDDAILTAMGFQRWRAHHDI